MRAPLLAFVLLAFCSTGSLAYLHPGSGGAPPVNPVLQNVADSFGNLTESGLGGVRLSTVDQNPSGKYQTYGIDLFVSGNPCATWTETQTGGTAGHWTLPAANTAEGASAITPVPSSPGFSAHLNGGPYTFSVSCKDALGNSSNTVTLTRTIITGYPSGTNGCINLGPTDRNFTLWPANTIGTLTNTCIRFSTGWQTPTSGWGLNVGAFTNSVDVAWSDTSRPGEMATFTFAGSNGPGNYAVHDMTLTGTSVANNAVSFNLGSNITATNIYAQYSSSIVGNHAVQFINVAGSGTNTVTNYGCDWCGTGTTPSAGTTYTNGYFRHPSNNALFLTNASHDFTINGLIAIDIQGSQVGQHGDCMQLADGSTPHDYHIHNYMCAAGSVTGTFQGQWFGGCTITAAPFYIDDGTGAHGPGKTITWPSGGICTGSNNSTIYGSLGSPLGIGDKVTWSCPGGSNCLLGANSGTVNIASNINYASPGSPALGYGEQSYNVDLDGIVDVNYSFHGLAEGSDGGTSNYSHASLINVNPTALSGQPNYPIAGGQPLVQLNCTNTNMHTGTFTINNVMTGTGYASDCTPSSTPPANTTLTNVSQMGNNNTNFLAGYNANPETVLQAIANATWDAMTIQQEEATVCNALLPKAGGTLDLGSGHWIGAFTATGEWASDGTIITGCGIH